MVLLISCLDGHMVGRGRLEYEWIDGKVKGFPELYCEFRSVRLDRKVVPRRVTKGILWTTAEDIYTGSIDQLAQVRRVQHCFFCTPKAAFPELEVQGR